jgi:hypothetical protein
MAAALARLRRFGLLERQASVIGRSLANPWRYSVDDPAVNTTNAFSLEVLQQSTLVAWRSLLIGVS